MDKETAKIIMKHKWKERLQLEKELILLLEDTENTNTEKIDFFKTAINQILTDMSIIGHNYGIEVDELPEIYNKIKEENGKMKNKTKAKIEKPNLYYEINETIQVTVNKTGFPIIKIEGEGTEFLGIHIAEMRALIDVFTEIDSILPEPEEYEE
jgi:hypothetical protein